MWLSHAPPRCCCVRLIGPSRALSSRRRCHRRATDALIGTRRLTADGRFCSHSRRRRHVSDAWPIAANILSYLWLYCSLRSDLDVP